MNRFGALCGGYQRCLVVNQMHRYGCSVKGTNSYMLQHTVPKHHHSIKNTCTVTSRLSSSSSSAAASSPFDFTSDKYLASYQVFNCCLMMKDHEFTKKHNNNITSSFIRRHLSSSSSQSSTTAKNNTNGENHSDKDISSQSKIISMDEYDPVTTAKNIHKAAQWNQGGGPNAQWDPAFCAQCVDAYTQHLLYIQHYMSSKKNHNNNNSSRTNNNDEANDLLPLKAKDLLLSSETTERALKAMLKMKIPTHHLSYKVRDMEKLIGSIGYTPLTNQLSLRLLEANGKAGNIGRTLALLNLRKARGFPPILREYEYAIQSIQSAGLYLRQNRNIYLNDSQQPEIDNPTRFLDAILVNMSTRGVQLDTRIANRMLNCYASTGRSGKAQHYFYNVIQVEEEVEEDDDAGNNMEEDERGTNQTISNRKRRVRIDMKRHSLPYYKIPSDVKMRNEIKRPNRDGSISKLQWEKEKEWSPSLTAAFAFADSLTYGACGHQPIELDVTSWNTLIKVCCYRGAIFRALEILNETMPQNSMEPDAFSYNTILEALARVGDKNALNEMLTIMTNKKIKGNQFTVKSLVDGHLNAGDVSGAVTLTQDLFNQYKLLPPYTTHLKIIEFALGSDLLYEAKRQVYFIQQLWKWQPGDHDDKNLRNLMYATQRNPKLSKRSLMGLFAYFGEELKEEDFF